MNIRIIAEALRLLTDAHATTLQDHERQHILQALQDAGGNKSKAARTLGIERKTLYQKAQRLGIDLNAK